jgi:hypothetical protein
MCVNTYKYHPDIRPSFSPFQTNILVVLYDNWTLACPSISQERVL